ncbi:DUF3108 domain-containing protein [Elusimicrobiota bacterium]
MKFSDSSILQTALLIIFVIFASFAVFTSFASIIEVDKSTATQAVSAGNSISDTARAIGLGRERYIYNVYWGFIKVGRATMETTSTAHITLPDGAVREAYHIISTARTLPFFDAFYKVRDKNESWIDKETFLSLGFAKHLREGRFRREETVYFDHKNGRFKSTVEKKNGTIVREEGDMKPLSYDVLSSLFYVRSRELEIGKNIEIDINTRKDWPLVVKVLRKKTRKVPAGKFECILVKPELRDEGIFIQKGKSMKIWLTNDSRKIPVLLKAEVFIGSVKAELTDIEYKN